MINQLSLDGQWDILFDEDNEGREANWMHSEVFQAQASAQSIQVPMAWETIKQNYEGVAFYRKRFEVPADWEGKIVRIQFGAVNYLSEIWLNDEVVGFHEGGFTPFEFRVDNMLKVGEENILTLRVVGPLFLSEKDIDGMKALETPQWRGGITGGIWQSVELVATDEVYIEDVYIQTQISDNTATFHIQLDHTGIQQADVSVEIDILEAKEGNSVASKGERLSLHPGKNAHSWTIHIPDAIYWSPSDPHLYRAQVRVVQNEKESDKWSQRFGLRELTIKDKDFYLNGERIYIKASFFEGLYPNKIAYPDNLEMAKREIQLAKEAGFNMIRPWRRPPAPIWLDLADEMGVLVVGSPALECMQLPFSTPYLPARVEREIRQAVLRDRNRACIVQWELFNELHRPVLNQMMRPMAMMVRDLDPTRLILDESGGWAFGANMYLPNQYEPTKFNDIHNYPGPFINTDRYDGYLSIGMTEEEKKEAGLRGKTPGKNVVPGLMSYVSELGYGSLPDLTVVNPTFEQEGNPLTPAYRYHHRIHRQQQEILEESGFRSLYPDMQQFYLDQQAIHGRANQRMIEAVRANPAVDGYCIHALVAGDWILGAGLLDIWRNPKSDVYEGTKAANQPRILSIRSHPRNIYAEQGASLEILSVNDLEPVDGTLHLEIRAASGKRVYHKTISQTMAAGVSSILKEDIHTKKWKGNYTISAIMKADNGNILVENSYEIDVFPNKNTELPKANITVLDQKGQLSSFLRQAGLTPQTFKASHSISSPVFVTDPQDLSTMQQQTLNTFMEAGGTVVYLDAIKRTIEDSEDGLPFQAMLHPAKGLWTCIPHVVHEHPIFKGLPTGGMMQSIYENVWPTHTLRNIEGEGIDKSDIQPIVGSIGFDWFSKEHKMHYTGPGKSWWGTDVAEISIGKGRCIVSQLHLLEHLGQDPAADQILRNMIQYLKN